MVRFFRKGYVNRTLKVCAGEGVVNFDLELRGERRSFELSVFDAEMVMILSKNRAVCCRC